MCCTMTTLCFANGLLVANRSPTLLVNGNVSDTSLMPCKAAASFCVHTSLAA